MRVLMALLILAALQTLPRDCYEAAHVDGVHPLRVFWSVTLPLILPSIVAGWMLAFTLSLDDLVIASFVSGPQSTTLPMVVYSSIRLGVSPKINALATLLLLLTGLIITAAVMLVRRTPSQESGSAAAAIQ